MSAPVKKLRLLKVTVQPVYVIDDGESLNEAQTQPIVISPADWPDYPATLEAQRAEQEKALNEPSVG